MELSPYVIREELVQIFKQVSTVFDKNMSGFTIGPAINAIYKIAGRHIKSELNYDFVAKSFNQAFFLLNFLKNLIFLDVALDRGFDFSTGIVDIGCGSAPASIAAHSLFLKRGFKRPYFTLVDKSQRQIQMAQTICKATKVDIKSYTIEPFMFQNVPYNDTAIFSYFVCEQDKDFIDELYQQQNQFNHGFVIVDYDYVVNHIVNVFSQMEERKIQPISLSCTLPAEIASTLHRDEVTVYGCIYAKKS